MVYPYAVPSGVNGRVIVKGGGKGGERGKERGKEGGGEGEEGIEWEIAAKKEVAGGVVGELKEGKREKGRVAREAKRAGGVLLIRTRLREVRERKVLSPCYIRIGVEP